MKIRVDTAKCQGHGMCNAAAPDLFPLDDLGYCAVRELDVPDRRVDEARRGSAACPERAIEAVGGDA